MSDNVPAILSPGVYWRCEKGPCRQPSKCMRAECCMASVLEFTWQPRIEGDIAHVEEFLDGVHQITYGPMPSQLVEAFIVERKTVVTKTFMRIYGDETNGQDPSPQNQS